MSELVQGGERTLRDSLGSEGVHVAKLNDSICAQLCDRGMQALERATRSESPLCYPTLQPQEHLMELPHLQNAR